MTITLLPAKGGLPVPLRSALHPREPLTALSRGLRAHIRGSCVPMQETHLHSDCRCPQSGSLTSSSTAIPFPTKVQGCGREHSPRVLQKAQGSLHLLPLTALWKAKLNWY